ncbi:SBBP repeat-containing protein [Chloroflexota bacterium]
MVKKNIVGKIFVVTLVCSLVGAVFGSLTSDVNTVQAMPAPLDKPDAVTKAQVSETYGQLPLSFEANQGQADDQVRFLSRGNGYNLFLTSSEAVLTLSKHTTTTTVDPEITQATEYAVLRMQPVGANPEPDIAGVEELPGKSNYIIGNDPQQWHTNVPNYAKVRYQHIYSGVDLVYYGNQRQLEYDFIVAPGADAEAIGLEFKGAERLALDAQGNLIIHITGGKVIQNAPIIYQEFDGIKQGIPGGYVLLNNNMIGFQVGTYDTSRPLVIDPVVIFSTYLGGSGGDYGFGIAVDDQGCSHVTGYTGSTNFPTQDAYQGTNNGDNDAFVTKLSDSGNSLVYSTYLGGSNNDYGADIVVDGQGSAYIIGLTDSTNFPTLNPYQGVYGGGFGDVFVTKLSASGSSLVYSTYLGGTGMDNGYSIAVDGQGSSYVTGYTGSTNFPTQDAYQGALTGIPDAFVTKFSTSGSSLVYSTYLGGSGSDYGYGIAVDGTGSAYITGNTNSTNFPTQNPYQGTNAGSNDAFVTKFAASGNSLSCSTYLGGANDDYGYDIAVDGQSCPHVTGRTFSTNFPTYNAYQGTIAGDNDAFVTKFASSGSSLVYSDYLGGTACDCGRGIAVDCHGSAHVTGWTFSNDFPTQNACQETNAGGNDAFVTKFSTSGNSHEYSTYLGGNNDDSGADIAVDCQGCAYVTGDTGSTNYPTLNPYQGANAGGIDAFVTKLCSPPLDFGDAPDSPYPTLLTNDGARHLVDSAVFLGSSIDTEPDGQPDPDALGDDDDTNDDEDGVTFDTTLLGQCQQADIQITASQAGKLDAWIDFNDDGDWDDPNERIFNNYTLSGGINPLSFTVPCNAIATEQTFARFRFSTDGVAGYDGQADDGEVEDYAVSIIESSPWEPLDYDTDESGAIEIMEVLTAISDYFSQQITILQVLQVIGLYFSG